MQEQEIMDNADDLSPISRKEFRALLKKNKKYYRQQRKLIKAEKKFQDYSDRKYYGFNPLREISFSKKLVSLIIYSSIIMLFLSYILAFLNKITIAETLSSTIAQVVFSSSLAYLGKSLIENIFKYNKIFFKKFGIECAESYDSSVNIPTVDINQPEPFICGASETQGMQHDIECGSSVG